MEGITMAELIQIISQAGFPIVCCAWFMAKGHSASQANTDAINNMVSVVKNNTKAVERLCNWNGVNRRQLEGDNNGN